MNFFRRAEYDLIDGSQRMTKTACVNFYKVVFMFTATALAVVNRTMAGIFLLDI